MNTLGQIPPRYFKPKKTHEHAFKRPKPIEYEAIYLLLQNVFEEKKVIEFYSEEPNIDGIYEEE